MGETDRREGPAKKKARHGNKEEYYEFVRTYLDKQMQEHKEERDRELELLRKSVSQQGELIQLFKQQNAILLQLLKERGK